MGPFVQKLRSFRSASAVAQGMGDQDDQVTSLLEQIDRGAEALREKQKAYDNLNGEHATLAQSHKTLRTMLRNPKHVEIRKAALASLQAAFPDAVIGEQANKAHENIPK